LFIKEKCATVSDDKHSQVVSGFRRDIICALLGCYVA